MIHLLKDPRPGRARKLALAVGVAGTAALASAAVAPAAQAAPFTCSASGPGIQVGPSGTAPALAPVKVGDDASCTNQVAGIGDLLANNPLVDVDAITASTKLDGSAAAQRDQIATAAGGLTNLRIGSLSAIPGLDLSAITGQIPIPGQLQTVKLALPAQVVTILRPILAAAQLPAPLGNPALAAQINDALTNGITINTQQLIRDLVALPSTPLLEAQGTVATATARCVNGSAVLAGSTNLLPVKVLGQTIDLDTPGQQALNLDTAAIDVADLDLTQIKLPALFDSLGLTSVVKGTILTSLQNALVAQLKTALAANPIAIPTSLLQLTVKPKQEIRTATTLEERALEINLKLAGQQVLDLTTGTAKVGAAGVDCSPAPTPTTPTTPVVAPPVSGTAPSRASAAQQLLQCSERRLVLTNVLQRPDRVALFGVADKAFAGQTVTIRFNADKKDVATATVLPDGTFKTTAPLPSKAVRGTNAARYQARIGSITSLDLKLQRRMTVSNLNQATGMVTIKGKLVSPLPVGGATVLLQRRVSCNELQNVKRVKADADGNYEITVPAPTGESAVVYRLQSKVRNNLRNKKTYRTYTLPQGIDIAK